MTDKKNKGKYQAMVHLGAEGWCFIEDEGFVSVDEAVKALFAYPSNQKSMVIKIIDWEAKRK